MSAKIKQYNLAYSVSAYIVPQNKPLCILFKNHSVRFVLKLMGIPRTNKKATREEEKRKALKVQNGIVFSQVKKKQRRVEVSYQV